MGKRKIEAEPSRGSRAARNHCRRLDERLLSGLLLQRAGWVVDIYERVETELSGPARGMSLSKKLIARLRGLGLATDELGVHIQPARFLMPRDV